MIYNTFSKVGATIMFLVLHLSLICQSLTNHNPAVEDAILMIDEETESGTINFVFAPYLSDYTIEGDLSMIPITMTVCLLNTVPENESEPLNSEALSRFNWLYDEVSNCFLATQSTNFYENEKINISIKGKATDKAYCESNGLMGFNVNIQPAPCMNGINLIEDDNAFDYKCMGTSTVETSELLEFQFSAYPNPVSNKLYFDLDDVKEKLKIDILDRQGKIVKTFKLKNLSQGHIDIDKLPASSYVLKFSADGKLGYRSILKVN